MAYEIINHAAITPLRLFSLIRLVYDYPDLTEERILRLLQPSLISVNTSASKDVLDAAIKSGLLEGNSQKRYSLCVSPDEFSDYEKFRELMQKKLLGALVDNQNNYIFNKFIAWYCVKNAQALTMTSKEELAATFNSELFPQEEIRPLNREKLAGVDDWMSFLGFGFKMLDYLIIPDATKRIKPLIKLILQDNQPIQMRDFMSKLAERCPELDGGKLFEECWPIVYGGQTRGNLISLMLSTGLRSLDKTKHIELLELSDSLNPWELFPDSNSTKQKVTHIRLGDIYS